MKTIINQLFNIVFVVIFIGVISSCSKDDPTPESPKPSTINVTGVSLNKSTLSLAAGTHDWMAYSDRNWRYCILYSVYGFD